jgi:hypothetical protein
MRHKVKGDKNDSQVKNGSIHAKVNSALSDYGR